MDSDEPLFAQNEIGNNEEGDVQIDNQSEEIGYEAEEQHLQIILGQNESEKQLNNSCIMGSSMQSLEEQQMSKTGEENKKSQQEFQAEGPMPAEGPAQVQE